MRNIYRRLFGFTMIILLASTLGVLTSCVGQYPMYPRYSITSINVIPDSLREAHNKYVIDLVTVGSEHMANSDYDDVDDTLREAQRLANKMFTISVSGLHKEFNDSSSKDVYIKVKDFSDIEKRIYKKLTESGEYHFRLSHLNLDTQMELIESIEN